jgi:hypothetical protein
MVNENMCWNKFTNTLIMFSGGRAIPAWAIVVIVSSSMIIIGGIMYFIMKKIMLGSESGNSGGANVNYRSDDEV